MKNKRLKSDWSLSLEAMKDKNLKRMDAIMATCDEKEFVKNFHKLLNYFVAKPKRIMYNDKNIKGKAVRVVFKGKNG